MSGTSEPVRAPTTDPEWSRDMDSRVKGLENPTSQRVGDWVLSTNSTGDLIASNVNGGSVVLARKPADAETDPDKITDNVPAACIATKTAPQSVGSSGAALIFDGISRSQGGDWAGGKASFTSVIVPKTGVYNITAEVWFDSGNATMTAVVLVDGATMLASRANDGSGNAWMSATIAGQLGLTAGQAVGLFAQPDGTTRNVGAATVFSSAIPTTLTLSQVGS